MFYFFHYFYFFIPLGQDNIESELGPWSTIAPETLALSDGIYIPDFTATIVSSSAHLLMINIHSVEACAIVELEKRYIIAAILFRINAQMQWIYLFCPVTISVVNAKKALNLICIVLSFILLFIPLIIYLIFYSPFH